MAPVTKINRIYRTDCRKGMALLDPKTVDLVIADPPFAIGFKGRRSNYARTASKVLRGADDIPPEKYYQFSLEWMRQGYRVLKPNGAMFVFSGWSYLRDIENALHALGFVTVNHIIWPYTFGVYTRKKFVTSHYHILYLCKPEGVKTRRFHPFSLMDAKGQYGWGDDGRHGTRPDLVIGRATSKSCYHDRSDVWSGIPREYWTGKTRTPNKLPEALIWKMLRFTTYEKSLVLDPFVGSGTVPAVCKKQRRNFIGFEKKPDVFRMACKRIGQKP